MNSIKQRIIRNRTQRIPYAPSVWEKPYEKPIYPRYSDLARKFVNSTKKYFKLRVSIFNFETIKSITNIISSLEKHFFIIPTARKLRCYNIPIDTIQKVNFIRFTSLLFVSLKMEFSNFLRPINHFNFKAICNTKQEKS